MKHSKENANELANDFLFGNFEKSKEFSSEEKSFLIHACYEKMARVENKLGRSLPTRLINIEDKSAILNSDKEFKIDKNKLFELMKKTALIKKRDLLFNIFRFEKSDDFIEALK